MKHKYIYGPVPSRRLGFSLGIDLVPLKNCTFDCIYCQLGKTSNKTIERKEYLPAEEILKEVKQILKTPGRIDYLTFSGSGEPTLHSRIGYLLNEIKKITTLPIAVLTNGSLLFMPNVQKELLNADVVLPTLCAASRNILQRINRAHPDITIEKIIRGLINFRKIYNGKIWLEVMLIHGINNTPEQLQKLKQVIKKIDPDRIHLNTVVRPPSEQYAIPLSTKELQRVKNILGNNAEIIVGFTSKREQTYFIDAEKAILDVIKRRPVTVNDICSVIGLHKNEIIKCLDHMQKDKKIGLTEHDGQHYYEAT